MDLRDKKLAVIGAGRLGESLIQGLVDAGVLSPGQITATATREEHLLELENRLKVRATRDNRAAVEGADVILLAVKPQTVASILTEIRDVMDPGKVVISVAAAVTTAQIEAGLGEGIPVIRAMPNTPCLIKAGMTAVCGGRHVLKEQLMMAQKIFQSVGRCLILEEKYFDAVTGLSASGPAYIYIIIESLAEAGVKVGLPRNVATELAAQTVLGAGQMTLETGAHPALLKDQVTTPAGCTVDGILELEEGGLRVTLIKAVVKATRRASELVKG